MKCTKNTQSHPWKETLAKIQVQGKLKDAEEGPRTLAFCPNEKTTKCEG